MKKILFFIRSLNAGGAQRQLVVSAKGLAERGYEVLVLTFYRDDFYVDEFHGSKVRLLSLDKKGRWDLFGFFVRLVARLRMEAPDVVYSFLGIPNIFSVLVQPFMLHVRLVWGVRASNMDLDCYDWAARWSYWVECRLSRFADCIVANSHAGLEYAVAHGFPKSKMVVIPNGIDTDYFRPDRTAGARLRKSWGIEEDVQLIGLVGRIDPMKDHPTFLQAATLVKQQRPDVRFVCVGKGEERYEKSMRELATAMGLDDVLIWVGVYSDMVAVYNALDILSSSSSYGEGFSNVIGEAMACGIPCVVTDVGDSALIVGDTGVSVPPRNPSALAEAMIVMLINESLTTSSMLVRARVESEFTHVKLLERMISLLK